MTVKRDISFDGFENDEKSFVLIIEPKVYKDERGSFSEVLKDMGEWGENSKYPMWLSNTQWIRQINRSKSGSAVVRGCHAQKGIFCQGKMVEAVNCIIFDIITDARPNSETFGVSKIYILNPKIQNKVWVPRGFLHSFVTPKIIEGNEAIFMYYVDNSYNKESEICINPLTLLPDVVENTRKSIEGIESKNSELFELFNVFSDLNNINFSDKDKNGMDYSDFCNMVLSVYNKTGKIWYT